ncbi:MAG: LacI family DNA-binding transcriptional regulator [Deltaproteobacteria bacterium]|jgi:LacI family transcriptional regulator|nr:LacI family DNA-binding transcriptional regulator [Deltaproteobacteria bacterium]
MSRATIVDIAKELKISPSTVSRALRDHPDISKATKERVINVAKRLDYFPDSLAQGLKKRRTNTIGIIVPEIRHNFFASAISGIEDVTYKSDFTIMVCQSNEDYEREVINLRAMVSNRVAGLLVSLAQNTVDISHFDILQKRSIPVVFFDRSSEKINQNQVVVDDYQGAFDAVSHLIARGYQKIAHIRGPENISIGRDRYRGYLDALTKQGIPVNEKYIVNGGFRQDDGSIAIRKLLETSPIPDAVFAVNDPVAIGAYIVLKERNIQIPKEMALVGFSNDPVSALLEPALTTVSQPIYDIGKTAAKMLLEQIDNGEQTQKPIVKIYKTELIVRQSS